MSLSTVGVQAKYGLINKKKPAIAIANVRPKLNIFSEDLDDDEDGDVEKMNSKSEISRVNTQLANASRKKVASIDPIVQKALSEDPSCYDYDGTYDDFKAKEQVSHKLSQPSDNTAPKARYVTNLLTTAKMREKEKDRIYEKKLLKERVIEDLEYGDKPKFMTTAYKNKLIEDKKWEYEDRLADEVEQRTDVRKSGMEGFYANLLTKNVAMGGNVDEHAISVYTAGSNRQNHLLVIPNNNGDSNNNNSSSSSQSMINITTANATSTSNIRKDDNYIETSGVNAATTIDSSSSQGGTNSSLDFRKENYTKKKNDINQSSEISNVVVDATNSVDNIISSNNNTNAEEPTTIVINKVEQILSARERYLTRKRCSDSIS